MRILIRIRIQFRIRLLSSVTNLPAGTLSSVLKIKYFANTALKIVQKKSKQIINK
jgi:hypothetical protein